MSYKCPHSVLFLPKSIFLHFSYTYHIASNRVEGMEYRVIITPDEGEQYMLQDFAENSEFTIPIEEHGICSIIARMENTPDDVQTLEIRF